MLKIGISIPLSFGMKQLLSSKQNTKATKLLLNIYNFMREPIEHPSNEYQTDIERKKYN